MDMTMRPAAPAEQLYASDQSARIGTLCRSPGYLFGELDKNISVFFRNWMRNDPAEDTPEFKAEFKAVLDMLRSDPQYGFVLKNLPLMNVYCLNNAEGMCNQGRDFVFRADTQDYSYLIRCIPYGEDNHVYIHPYRRERLDSHMKQAEKGVRFVALDGKEKFRVPDGDMIRIITGKGGHLDRLARYVDDNHVEINGSFYHIREFAEWMEQINGKVIPLRSSLPEKCFSITPATDKIVIIVKGETVQHPVYIPIEGRTARESVTAENQIIGVTRAQEAAMLAGSLFGWDTPAADPKDYDEQGQPIKPKRHDRGDAR